VDVALAAATGEGFYLCMDAPEGSDSEGVRALPVLALSFPAGHDLASIIQVRLALPLSSLLSSPYLIQSYLAPAALLPALQRPVSLTLIFLPTLHFLHGNIHLSHRVAATTNKTWLPWAR